ncbi:hypothetical protein, partial [Photobacterium phosphoreum]|uniref:hypothetical protein n=1 Tax=Photobacterium phosphoreum TaxID=659 RepID=UPI0019616704
MTPESAYQVQSFLPWKTSTTLPRSRKKTLYFLFFIILFIKILAIGPQERSTKLKSFSFKFFLISFSISFISVSYTHLTLPTNS